MGISSYSYGVNTFCIRDSSPASVHTIHYKCIGFRHALPGRNIEHASEGDKLPLSGIRQSAMELAYTDWGTPPHVLGTQTVHRRDPRAGIYYNALSLPAKKPRPYAAKGNNNFPGDNDNYSFDTISYSAFLSL